MKTTPWATVKNSRWTLEEQATQKLRALDQMMNPEFPPLSPELEAELSEAMDDLDKGNGISAEDVYARLKAKGL